MHAVRLAKVIRYAKHKGLHPVLCLPQALSAHVASHLLPWVWQVTQFPHNITAYSLASTFAWLFKKFTSPSSLSPPCILLLPLLTVHHLKMTHPRWPTRPIPHRPPQAQRHPIRQGRKETTEYLHLHSRFPKHTPSLLPLLRLPNHQEGQGRDRHFRPPSKISPQPSSRLIHPLPIPHSHYAPPTL